VVKQPTVVVEPKPILVKQPTATSKAAAEPEVVVVKQPTTTIKVVAEPEAVVVKQPTSTVKVVAEPEVVVAKQPAISPELPKVVVATIDQAQSAFDDPTYGAPIREWPTNSSPAEVVAETTPLITKPDASIKVESPTRTRRIRKCVSRCCGSGAIKKELDKVKVVEKKVESKAKEKLKKVEKKAEKDAAKVKGKAVKATKG